MLLMNLVVTLVLVGLVLYLINRFIPMQPNIKTLLNIAVVVFLVLWLLGALGLWSGFSDIRLGR